MRFKRNRVKKKPRSLPLTSYIKNNGLLLLFSLLLLFGIFCGSMISGKDIYCLDTITKSYLTQRASGNYFSILLFSMESVAIFFSVIFLSGISALGMITIPVTILFKGIGIGSLISYIYLKNGYDGIVYCLILVIPYSWISIILFMVQSREAMVLSSLMCNHLFFKNEKKPIFSYFKRFCSRSAIILLLLTILSLLDSILVCILGANFIKDL